MLEIHPQAPRRRPAAPPAPQAAYARLWAATAFGTSAVTAAAATEWYSLEKAKLAGRLHETHVAHVEADAELALMVAPTPPATRAA